MRGVDGRNGDSGRRKLDWRGYIKEAGIASIQTRPSPPDKPRIRKGFPEGVIKTTGKAGIFLLRHSLTVQAKRNVLYTWDGEQEKSHT